MPQQPNQQPYVFRDSLQLDTIWLDVNALPAKTFNPVDTPDLVFFNVDSAIAHQVNWAGVDTFTLHKTGNRDTILAKSFLNTYHTKGKVGIPETTSQPKSQLILSASVLILVFACFSIIFTTSKNRIIRYFLSIFNKRRFKEYFVEESPRLLPTMPVIYLVQSVLVGSVLSVWLFSQMNISNPVRLIGITALVMLGYAIIPLLRNGLIMVLGNVFMIQTDARKHIFISYLSHSLLFILLVPVAIQMAIQVPGLNQFFNITLYTCLALTMGYQLIKLIQNTSLPDVGALLYIFLYFCTLEILPLFLIYKAVSLYA
jgi:hypothetical protein